MKNKILLSFFVLIFAASTSFSQSIKIGLGGGYTALTGDNSLTAENILNLNSGYHYGGKLVVGLPLFPLTFTGTVYQNSLSSEVDITESEKVDSEINFLSVGLGAEMTMIPGPLSLYISGEYLYTTFGAPSINGETFGDSESKNGIGIGAGLYFKLLPMFDINLSAHYNMNTLLSSGDSMNSTHIRLNVLLSIL